MGNISQTCNQKCTNRNNMNQYGSVFELNFENHQECLQKKQHQMNVSQKTRSETYKPNGEVNINDPPSLIQDEQQSQDQKEIPSFVQTKKIQETFVIKKYNRFLLDLEQEVKNRIHEIQLEEEKYQREQREKEEKKKQRRQQQIQDMQYTYDQALYEQQVQQMSETIKETATAFSNKGHKLRKGKQLLEQLLDDQVIEDSDSINQTQGLPKSILKKYNSMRYLPRETSPQSNTSQNQSNYTEKRKVHFSPQTNFSAQRKGISQKMLIKWSQCFDII